MIPDLPSYIQIFPSLLCNSSCEFCFNRGLSPTRQMGLKDFQGVVNLLSSLGIRKLDILGGEPTIYPDLAPALDYAISAGLRVSMSTNGSRGPVLRALSERFPRESLSIGVSINCHEVDPELHDYIMACRPVIKTVSRRDSLVVGSALQYLGLPGVTYYLIYRDSLSAADLGEAMPFPQYLSRLDELRAAYPNIDGVHCGFVMDPSDELLRKARCSAGVTKLSVMPDGSVYPCYLLARHPEFMLGNIFSDDFERIWGSPVLRFFREFKGNTCAIKSCGIHTDCHGGCPAISLLLGGDIGLPDPRCRKS
ncbi:MAG: SPASM domain-containing protein, partial [Nitrospirales bacterium]|nr:SPASM domain-containing protein [Nitrospirales bacterium]